MNKNVNENDALYDLVKFECKGVITTGNDTYVGAFDYGMNSYVFTCYNSIVLGAVVNRTPDNYREKIVEAREVVFFCKDTVEGMIPVTNTTEIDNLICEICKCF